MTFFIAGIRGSTGGWSKRELGLFKRKQITHTAYSGIAHTRQLAESARHSALLSESILYGHNCRQLAEKTLVSDLSRLIHSGRPNSL